MYKHKHLKIVIIFLILFVVAQPLPAQAIPPPDFIFAIGSQFLQVLSLLFVFFLGAFGFLLRWSRSYWHRILAHKVFFFPVFAAIIALSIVGAFLYDSQRQVTSRRKFEEEVSLALKQQITQRDTFSSDTLDSTPPVAENPKQNLDPQEAFIIQYYTNLGTGHVEEAYAVSKKSVPLETYRTWYVGVTAITVEAIERIDINRFTVGIQLEEGDVKQRYAVLMTLEGERESLRITDSVVREIADEQPRSLPIEQPVTAPNYLSTHLDLPLSITNEEFKGIDAAKALVVDAREDEEYEIGRYPSGLHQRFADLLAGGWVSLPTDKEVLIICWSGIRGQEVAEFLRGKGIAARYLEDGASGWVKSGGTWFGGIAFSSAYSEKRYSVTFSSDQVRQYITQGTLLVDVREGAKYSEHHISGSINISSIFTPTIELGPLLAQVPAHSTVITVCDDFLSCFDAKIVGIKLEKLGHTFIGRFTRPYEF